MNPDWQAFLRGVGATLEGDQVLHFGNPENELRAALAEDSMCDLSHQGLIAATGPDSGPFLQGQLTNDVRQVTPVASQLSAYCNPKGRMLACFRLFRSDDTYYLRMPRERVDPVIKRLKMFILRARTRLEDVSDNLARLGVAGPHAARLLGERLGRVPETVEATLTLDTLTVVRVPGLPPRFEVHGTPAALETLWHKLSPQMRPVGAAPWRLLDILAGVPNVYGQTAEAFVPQMANLQLLNGLSFHKGCYTGQEIVARTHYLGKLKRRMYLARVDTPTQPQPGDELFSPATGPNQSAGKIVDACRHPDGGFALLATVLIACAESAEVFLGEAGGALLEFHPLPYAFEAAPD